MLDRDKLAKILGLLGSDKIGEIVSAARAADALIRKANTSWAEVLNQNAVGDDARAVDNDNEARARLAEYEVLALSAKNEKLRETVMQLSLENAYLREQAARRLAHRILDGAKQSGQALLALAIVFDGIAFLRRQLAARHRDSQSSTQRVVVHGCVAAAIALAMGIVGLLSLQDIAMLGAPSGRSGIMASSGQKAPEAAARSGALTAQAEKSAPSAAEKLPASVAENSPSAVVEKLAAMAQGPAAAARAAQPSLPAFVAIENPPKPPELQPPIQSQSSPTSPPVSSPIASASLQSAESGDLQQANLTQPTIDDKELADPAAREAIARGWALYYLPYTAPRWQQARREFEQAFEIDPRSGEARIGLAAILSTRLADGWSPSLQEDLPRAERLLMEVIDNGSVSNRAAAHFTLGVLRRMKNRLPEAQAELETAISLDPNNARAYLHLGETLLYLGEPEAAIPPLEQAIRLHSDERNTAIIYWALGTCRLLSGRLGQAIESLQNARAANPHLWMPHLYLAGAYALQGDLEAAKSALTESMRLKPAIRSLAGMRAENPWLTNPQYWVLQEKTLNVGLRRARLPDQWSAEVSR
jgi:tetratricopeptide (TPR) repeat protein